MCGIVYVNRKDGKRANKTLWKRYRKQDDRGKSGFGFITNGKDERVYRNRFREEKETHDKLKESVASEILFHHRLPTSVPNLPEGNHPIKVSHEELSFDYYVTHNGVIRNDEELKKKHEALGYQYETEMRKEIRTSGKVYRYEAMWNDSEPLAIEFARAIEGKQERVEAEGASAIIAWQVDKKHKKLEKVFFARNESNPLMYSDKKEMVVIGSETEGELIDPHKLYWLENGKLDERELIIGSTQEVRHWDTGLGSYSGLGYHTESYGLGYDAYEDEGYDIEDDEDYQAILEDKKEIEKEIRRARIESNYEREELMKAELNWIDYRLQNYLYEKK